MKTVLYPGSFDPVTNGHLDVAHRAARIFDRLIIGVAANSEKNPLFSFEERIRLLREVCKDMPNTEIVSFSGLLINAVNEFDVSAVIRGIRAVSDFEYEFQMALMNRELNERCETLFMMPSPEYSYVSSRLIKEIARCGGDISPFVPPTVASAIVRKCGKSPGK
ncbi:MAG: Phosphopantetheine adenylyltransferase [Lentisphaerae bacterium ADurb.Bin242]|nr:MAG: Phosphopantetheine adenylyltransferase [Lentisphaerae bacterium ADurb.Bin242]